VCGRQETREAASLYGLVFYRHDQGPHQKKPFGSNARWARTATTGETEAGRKGSEDLPLPKKEHSEEKKKKREEIEEVGFGRGARERLGLRNERKKKKARKQRRLNTFIT